MGHPLLSHLLTSAPGHSSSVCAVPEDNGLLISEILAHGKGPVSRCYDLFQSHELRPRVHWLDSFILRGGHNGA